MAITLEGRLSEKIHISQKASCIHLTHIFRVILAEYGAFRGRRGRGGHRGRHGGYFGFRGGFGYEN